MPGWKVVNRHGVKPELGSDGGPLSRAEADAVALLYNERGFDDGPFTVQPWGDKQGWYSVEGHREAAVERGEEPDA